MPSTYAHDCFGKAVYKQLPKEIQKEIKAYGPLYMAGLHGPDILFYYKPLRANAVNQIGFGMHARPAAEFFEQAWKKGKELSANRGGFAYLYGFICHFALDHSCHGYIEEKIQKSGVTIHYLSASAEWQFLRERENFSFSDVRKKTSIEFESIIW